MKNDNIDKGNIYKPIYYGNWEEKILYDLAVWKNGLAFKNINFTDIGKPVIKIAELKNGITSQTKFTQDIFDDSVYLTKGDMLFSWSGNPETSIDVFYYDLPDGWLNQHIFKITTKDDVFYKYFFYILKYLKPNFTVIATNKQTTGLGHVTINDLKRIKIKLPPLEEQKKIASILSSLDDKIELNNRMNKILEETTQTIFKEWFINFNFPNEEGKPYKKNGGNMIESELGEIPEGWDVTNLDNLLSKFTTGLNPRQNFKLGEGNNYYVTIKNMNDNQIYLDNRCDKINDDAIIKINKRSDLRKNDLLFSGIGTIGRVYLINKDVTNWNISESIFTMRVNDIITPEYLYLNLLDNRMQEYALNLASGSVQKGIRMGDLKKYKMIIPKKEILILSTKIFSSIIEKVNNNFDENQKLAVIRDSILPKLMSGEIRIK